MYGSGDRPELKETQVSEKLSYMVVKAMLRNQKELYFIINSKELTWSKTHVTFDCMYGTFIKLDDLLYFNIIEV